MCEYCADSWSVYLDNEPIASSERSHTVLLRCARCGDLFSFIPEGREAPSRLTDAEARAQFPGYAGGSGRTTMRIASSVLDELREERHPPMVALLDELSQHEWAATLRFDLSMLRLWIARQGRDSAEIMIVYGDGRGGGRPNEPYVDAFDLTFFSDGVGSKCTGTRADILNVLRNRLERGA